MVRRAQAASGAMGATEPFEAVGMDLPNGVTIVSGGVRHRVRAPELRGPTCARRGPSPTPVLGLRPEYSSCTDKFEQCASERSERVRSRRPIGLEHVPLLRSGFDQ